MTRRLSRTNKYCADMTSVSRTPSHGFDAIFEAEFAYLWTSLRRLGVPTRDVEDVTHDVFLAVHKHLHEYDPARSIRPWLFAFAFRFASDYRRRGRNRFEDLGGRAPDAISRAPSADAIIEKSEARDLVFAALNRMTDPDRRAVEPPAVRGPARPSSR